MSNTKIRNVIHKLSKQGEKVIESEAFYGLNYVVKDGHVVLISQSNGMFSCSFEAFDVLSGEIKDIISEWKDIKTKKCPIS